MRIPGLIASVFVLIISLPAAIGHTEEPPWISLFDGKALGKGVGIDGNAKVVDGRVELTEPGILAYRYRKGDFENFDLTMEVLTDPGAKASVAFDSAVDPSPTNRVGIDNSREWKFWRHGYGKTGSLTFRISQFKSLAKDREWFKLRIRVEGGRICVWVNDILVTDAEDFRAGEFCIYAESHDAKISLRNMRFRNLQTKGSPEQTSVIRDAIEEEMASLRYIGFPLINYHIHLKGDLTLEKALEHSRETGVFYGIAANCGVNFPITNDQGINDYIKKMEGQPCFVGMQAEGREWPTLFSKQAIAKFDYIFTDAMTIVDHRGRRARLWMSDEVDIPDKQAFMELLVRTIEEILDNEPVDIYANPTYLPDMLSKEYDTLWTPARLKRVIDVAARNGVAIEISNRLKLPKADFIRQAKKAGIKFTIGTNNVDSKLGREEYALQMIRECDLKPSDMFLPKPDGKKPIQVRGFKSK